MESTKRPAWTSSGGWDAYKHLHGQPEGRYKNFFTKPCNQIGPELKRKEKK